MSLDLLEYIDIFLEILCPNLNTVFKVRSNVCSIRRGQSHMAHWKVEVKDAKFPKQFLLAVNTSQIVRFASSKYENVPQGACWSFSGQCLSQGCENAEIIFRRQLHHMFQCHGRVCLLCLVLQIYCIVCSVCMRDVFRISTVRSEPRISWISSSTRLSTVTARISSTAWSWLCSTTRLSSTTWVLYIASWVSPFRWLFFDLMFLIVWCQYSISGNKQIMLKATWLDLTWKFNLKLWSLNACFHF